MTEQHHDHPLVNIMLSSLLGLASWLADPTLWRAVAVAAICGFIGGVAKAVGAWSWRKWRGKKDH